MFGAIQPDQKSIAEGRRDMDGPPFCVGPEQDVSERRAWMPGARIASLRATGPIQWRCSAGHGCGEPGRRGFR